MEDMAKREYLGHLELMILLAIMRSGSKAYGVVISREIEDKTGRNVSLGSVYAALERLENKKLVVSTIGEPSAERGGKARTYFKLTAAGLKE
ncbi:MAG: PadR family transcriptional regulator, partial [Steroidobacter sp.]